jgi:hypothetical protein
MTDNQTHHAWARKTLMTRDHVATSRDWIVGGMDLGSGPLIHSIQTISQEVLYLTLNR